jgi:hypothetical protein
MTKVLFLYYSSYGHVEKLTGAVAEGARSTGAQVDVKRVRETVPLEIARSANFKLDQTAPVAAVAELEGYDAIIVGTGTRYGRMASQMAGFPRSDQRAVDAWHLQRQGRRCLYVNRHAARRPGDDPVLDHHQSAALWNDHRRASLQLPGPDERFRDCRRRTLRRNHRGGR